MVCRPLWRPGKQNMATVTLDLAPEVLSALRLDPDGFVAEMRLAAAIYWYQRGEMSQAAAAALADRTRLEFLDLLAHKGLDVFVVDIEDVKRELARG